MISFARCFGLFPRRSAKPYSVTMPIVSCSVWSMCVAKGTMAEIFPSFAVEGDMKIV
jgi:hypothetical protein